MIKKISNTHDLYLIYNNYRYAVYNSYDGIVARSNKIDFNNDSDNINIIIDINDNYNASNIKKCITLNILEYESNCTDKKTIIKYNGLQSGERLNNKYYLSIDIKKYN